MVRILKDERKDSSVKECEHCGCVKEGRCVKVGGVMFQNMEESRGSFFICFDCFAPRIKWEHYNEVRWNPVEVENKC